MHGPILGEFMGTLVLILLGDGVVAGVLLNKSKAEGAGWLAITTGWGLAVIAGIFTAIAFGSPGAHINPAISLAVALASGQWSFVPVFWLAQMAGAIVGAALVWLVYLPHWRETPDAAVKLGIFCNAPAIRKPAANLLTEIIATAFLVIVGFSFGSKAAAGTGLPVGFLPSLWGALVWAIGLSLGGPTGYAINPARDLGPRLAHAILPISGKGSSDWRYAWIPVIGPLIGGAIGSLIIQIGHIN